MADSVSPQGIIAVSFMVDASFSLLWGEGALNPKLIAVLSRVQDPGNAGTILRVADAAGADLVITTKGSVDLYNPKTVRSTAGSLFHVPIIPVSYTHLPRQNWTTPRNTPPALIRNSAKASTSSRIC